MAPTAAQLTEHAAFLKRLARALVKDEHAAEDLVQDAYAAALGRPALRDPRPWLAATVRKLGLARRRTAGRRARRERAAARPEAIPGAADRVARVEVQQRVVAAVLALDERYRDTILLRFFEGLSVREIAARHGVPARTVRTRLARGLEQLRGRLDRVHGDRRAWVLALLPLAGGAALSAGAVVAVAAVLALVVGGAFLAARKEGVRGQERAATERRADAPSPGPPLDPAPAETRDVSEAAHDRGPVDLTVTVVAADTGLPLPGVRVTVREPTVREERTTGDDGTLQVRQQGELWLDFAHRGYQRKSVGLGRRAAVVALDPGVPVAVRVVDAETGRPPAWAFVSAVELGTGMDHGNGAIDADGRYDIEGVRPGIPFQVAVLSTGCWPVLREASFAAAGEMVIEVGAGGVVDGRVTGSGGEPVPGAGVVVAPVEDLDQLTRMGGWSTGASGHRIPSTVDADAAGRFRMRGLPLPGAYRAGVVHDGRLAASAPFAVSAARPRAECVVAVGAPLTVDVVFTGDVRPEYPWHHTSLHDLDSTWADSAAQRLDPDGVRYVVPWPGRYEVRASGPGFLPVARQVEVSAPVRVELALDRGAVLRGIAVTGAGDAVVTEVSVRQGEVKHSTWSREDGTFDIEGLRDEPGVLHVPARDTAWGDVVIEARPGGDPVRVVLPRAAQVVGSASPGRIGAVVDTWGPGGWRRDAVSVDAGADGRFRVPGLSPDTELRIRLERPDAAPVVLRIGGIAPGTAWDAGAVAFVPGVRWTPRVRDDAGAPVPGTFVQLWYPELGYVAAAHVDREGRAALGHLPAGRARVSVEPPGFVWRSFEADVPGGLPPEIVVERGVELVWEGETGKRVDGPHDPHAWRAAQDLGDGRRRVRLLPGRYRLPDGREIDLR